MSSTGPRLRQEIARLHALLDIHEQRHVEQEAQLVRYRTLVHELTDKCNRLNDCLTSAVSVERDPWGMPWSPSSIEY